MTSEIIDVLIVGAGLSGIGAARHLQKICPKKTYAILEARDAIGGTWDLFRYPGIRSDSDMFTLGYSFKPWNNPKSIADGEDIRHYIEETARENNIERNIRFGHKVISASWDSDQALWTVQVQRVDEPQPLQIQCNFFIGCTGYYNYDKGYTPEFPGSDRFGGQIVHPQHWPDKLDYRDKRVVVIGSGATAVTLVPAMAEAAAHVTMLQRSPSYVASVPLKDKVAIKLRKYLPAWLVYRMARTRQIGFQMAFYRLARAKPKMVRRLLLGQVRKQVGPDFDMTHFSPQYNPWDERLCAVPNGDLFRAIRKGNASVETDHIETFTEKGILLKSGKQLEADIIITATGLDLQMLGGTQLEVDGKPFVISNSMNYKGVMFQDLPNFAMIFGYTNASWTLKSDITSEFLCRLIKEMDKRKLRQCTPRLADSSVEALPFIEMRSGYLQRAMSKLPKQGSVAPWKLHQNYAMDLAMLRFGQLDDGTMTFSNPAPG
ncbi:NAD(P)/FAD-dependent oxidoreductase [Ketobacter sp. MCCC 1A13808]|uniref:flavin-containing monooxygenase n=1 Tax=Ketobacter sp. MCCC 1A13808 TaxID=2602738 RepID=UPI0012EBDEE9|nr:NAD(P)/FAD-dependent oxidoreductase [Ketobacter sp. MCCC 1A13808]MVF12787.1 NAD(P)/FAD-dependent oxidoreductase [Ketobacter sp. MCCC 1A13808]